MKIINKATILSLIFFIILYTVCTIFFSKSFAAGVLCGYLLSVLNFFMLSRKIKNAFSGNLFGALVFNSQVRLLGSAGVVLAAYKYLGISLFGVLVGLSVLTLCIPLAVIYQNCISKDKDEESDSDECSGSVE
jgi:hypothetical protein